MTEDVCCFVDGPVNPWANGDRDEVKNLQAALVTHEACHILFRNQGLDLSAFEAGGAINCKVMESAMISI